MIYLPYYYFRARDLSFLQLNVVWLYASTRLTDYNHFCFSPYILKTAFLWVNQYR